MFGINTRIVWHKPFRSDLSDELVRLYKYFLGDPVKAPTNVRGSVLDPGSIIVELPMLAHSFTLRPVEELEAAKKRKRDSQWRMEQIARKKPLITPK